MSINFEKLIKDIKECCDNVYYGKCHKCPYRYMSLYVCRLQYVDTDELEALHKISEFRGNLNSQKSDIDRDFEADLHLIKVKVDELCKNVDDYIKRRSGNE